MAGRKQRVIKVRSTFVNSFIIYGERAVIVDTGIPGYDAAVLSAMEKYGVKPADVSLILITHGHHDHYGSAVALKQKTGAPVAIHKDDSEALRTGINPKFIPIGMKGKIMVGLSGMMKMPAIKGMEPDILIDGEMDLSKYGIAGKVVPTPGHTRGSVSVLLDGGCALIGDLIFGGFIRKKAPGFPYFGYDSQEIYRSIQKVLDFNPKIIYAGHGGPFTAGSVRRRFFNRL
ncbi:MAG: MBL fold metallo-hydrolase [Dehalococcoidia bacterium]|jgi:glyoxylase-like metal-dependent hydrolase (beta-lactamase superfamily II)